MKYLLDTQIYIWILQNNSSLNSEIKAILTNHQNTFFLSSETLREMAIKYRIKKIQFNDNFDDIISEIPQQFGIKILEITTVHLVFFANFSDTEHKDPVDLLIISQAICENITLISADRNFPYYKKDGLKLIEA